jgi:BirA family transcriptional regulator, biotin operon repressor / biotin---[acetyl-CoA-carboxylase] ligase
MTHCDRIVELLFEARGEPVSGSKLGRRLGISRTAVWKNIHILRSEGYEITVVKGQGYRLETVTKSPVSREILRGLKTKWLGRDISYFKEVDSTNIVAKELARKGGAHGSIVVAEVQTHGRGRLGRSWESPPGGVYLSIILRPDMHPAQVALLTLLAGVAVIRGIKQISGVDTGLKWPNDIMVSDCKLGGVLCEMEGESEHVDFVVIGIGIDVNFTASVDIPTTSLRAETGGDVDITKVIQEILEEFELLYSKFQIEPTGFLPEYKRYCLTLGRMVSAQGLRRSVTGRAVDISPGGGLLVELEGRRVEEVVSGEIIHLR